MWQNSKWRNRDTFNKSEYWCTWDFFTWNIWKGKRKITHEFYHLVTTNSSGHVFHFSAIGLPSFRNLATVQCGEGGGRKGREFQSVCLSLDCNTQLTELEVSHLLFYGDWFFLREVHMLGERVADTFFLLKQPHTQKWKPFSLKSDRHRKVYEQIS